MKCHVNIDAFNSVQVALFTRAWIEIYGTHLHFDVQIGSPSLRGRGLKFTCGNRNTTLTAWSPSLRGRGLKCFLFGNNTSCPVVALFTRAWIEIYCSGSCRHPRLVALFTRAWIEITLSQCTYDKSQGRPLYEGVD